MVKNSSFGFLVLAFVAAKPNVLFVRGLFNFVSLSILVLGFYFFVLATTCV